MSSTVSVENVPDDVQALLEAFTAIERDADNLLDSLDDEQFNWSPRPGAWSIGQCFDHLNTANRVYLECLEHALANARTAGWQRRAPISPTVFGRLFVQQLEPPPRYRMKAPGRIKAAEQRRYKAEVWPTFVRTHRQIRSCLERAADLDLNRASFRNPFIAAITMRCGTAFHVMAAHDRRHVWQANAVRTTPGFPRG
jgi:hypothetical protein